MLDTKDIPVGTKAYCYISERIEIYEPSLNPTVQLCSSPRYTVRFRHFDSPYSGYSCINIWNVCISK